MKEQVKLGNSVKSWRREWNFCLCVPGAGVGKWTDEEVDATLTPAEVAFARRIAGLVAAEVWHMFRLAGVVPLGVSMATSHALCQDVSRTFKSSRACWWSDGWA